MNEPQPQPAEGTPEPTIAFGLTKKPTQDVPASDEVTAVVDTGRVGAANAPGSSAPPPPPPSPPSPRPWAPAYNAPPPPSFPPPPPQPHWHNPNPANPAWHQAPPPQPAYYPPPYVPKRMNAMAIAALVGALVLAPLGIVFGHIALSQIKRTEEDGKGLAVAGLVIGYVLTGLFIAMLVIWVIFFAWLASEYPSYDGTYDSYSMAAHAVYSSMVAPSASST